MTMQSVLFSVPSVEVPAERGSLFDRAVHFCETAAHRNPPFSKRNWGGPLHSLCSYQGKLKPAIAHFLIESFTRPGDRVLDPMCGVGTIPLEARRQGRIAVAGDLSPLAVTVTRAKVETVDSDGVSALMQELTAWVSEGPKLDVLVRRNDAEFGLNGPIASYFHEDTLREVLRAREFFAQPGIQLRPASAVVMASVLHILHGNRPYALSRRSHPITPFAPTGPAEYRSLAALLGARLDRVLPELEALDHLSVPGEVHQVDFRDLATEPVDAVVTSPPFSRSVRFWSSNWMRLWFCGWTASDFATEPARYLETQQRKTFEPYTAFSSAMARLLKPRGLLVMHLGETVGVNMADHVAPMLEPEFRVVHIGRECVADTESHGLVDKGATVAHWYLFAERRD